MHGITLCYITIYEVQPEFSILSKGYTSPREYIATQSPLLETRNDFWRMIWEQNVDIIVMLAKRVDTIKVTG